MRIENSDFALRYLYKFAVSSAVCPQLVMACRLPTPITI